MPPRRSKAGTSSSGRTGQATLSFNNKGGRVTKPSISHPTSDKKPSSKLNEAAKSEIISQISTPEPNVVEVELENEAQKQQPEIEAEEVVTRATPTKSKSKKKSRNSTSSLTSDELDTALSQAASIPESRIKKYWKAEEDSRLAPRVHQQTLPIQEKILRHFDLSSQYGPCIGIPRLNRWKRAYTLNLSPPIEVLAVLLKEESKGKDKRQTGTIAYVDELGGGRSGIVE